MERRERKDRKKRKKKEIKEKEKERKMGGKEVQLLLVSNVRTARGLTGQEVSWSALQEVGVLSYSSYSLFKGHSMAMRCSPNGGTGARTIMIKLLMIYGPVSGSFMFPELQF